jgi:hypothetical protein
MKYATAGWCPLGGPSRAKWQQQALFSLLHRLWDALACRSIITIWELPTARARLGLADKPAAELFSDTEYVGGTAHVSLAATLSHCGVGQRVVEWATFADGLFHLLACTHF